jgi:hypothetical protein
MFFAVISLLCAAVAIVVRRELAFFVLPSLKLNCFPAFTQTRESGGLPFMCLFLAAALFFFPLALQYFEILCPPRVQVPKR